MPGNQPDWFMLEHAPMDATFAGEPGRGAVFRISVTHDCGCVRLSVWLGR